MVSAKRDLKILISNPYMPTGGGGQIQAKFRRVMEKCLPWASIDTISFANSSGGLRFYLNSSRQALECCRQGIAPDLLILQSYLNPASVVLGRHARKHKIPYILIPRGDLVPTVDLWFAAQRPGYKRMMWLLLGRQLVDGAAAVVTTSEMEKFRLQRVGARTRRFYIIPDPIALPSPDSRFASLTPPENEREERPFALWLGRIAREKGLELLLESWPAVLLVCPQAELILAGPVSHIDTARRLKDLHRKLGLGDAVRFLDWVGDTEKMHLLAKARCLVLPSHFESFGLVVVEALIMQTHVIASTGTPWPQIDGVAGHWLPRKPLLWAQAISGYLTAPHKEKVSEKEVMKLLTPYSERVLVDKWVALLKDIL